MQLWLYLHFPALQLDSLRLAEPQRLSEQPVAVVDEQSHQLVQLNDIAREAGLRVGMGLGSAASLCAGLEMVVHDVQLEEQRLGALARWLYWVTSDIVLFAPDGLLLGVTPMLGLHNNLEAYWQHVEAHLAQQKMDYRLATGPSPLAARLLARNGMGGLYEAPKAMQEALERVPVEALELSIKARQKLTRLGLKQLGQVLALPSKAMGQRFEMEVLTYLGHLQGQYRYPVDFFHPPEAFDQYLELLFDMDNSIALLKPLNKLLLLLEDFLRLRDKGVSELRLCLRMRDTAPLTLSLGSSEPQYQAAQWLQLAELRFETLKLPAPVYGIRLQAPVLQPYRPAATDLFAGKQGKMSALQLVNQLQTRLGQERVQGVGLAADYRPECASVAMPPLTRQSTPPVKLPGLRPLFLYPSPRPLRQWVRLIQGPERIETAWWQGKRVLRDYFVARSQSGTWLWLFRTAEQRWYIHGIFS